MILEHGICTLFFLIFMSKIIQGPPLYIENKSAFFEEWKKRRRRRQFFGETMTRDEKGTSYDGEEHIKS